MLLFLTTNMAAVTSRANQQFEYLYRKSRCEILIGGDDISNDVITLGASFHVPLNVCLHSRSFPLRADWRKLDSSVDREPQGNWKQNSNFRDVVTSSPSFSRSADRALRRTFSQARIMVIVRAHFFYTFWVYSPGYLLIWWIK